MSIEPRQALYAHLVADPGVVAALKGDAGRVHQRRVPTGAPKPLLVIWPPQSRVPEMDLSGPAWRRTRIQLTAMAMTQPEAEKIARAVMDAVEGYQGSMSGLPVLLIEVIDDHQIDQEGVDEIHHHVILRITHK